MSWNCRRPAVRAHVPLLAAVVVLGIPLLDASAQPSFSSRTARQERQLAVHREKHAELRQQFSDDLERLAHYCDDNELAEAATKVRQLTKPVSLELLRADPLPQKVRADIPADLSPNERYWRTQLRFAQEKQAKALYLLSRRVLYAGSPSYALDLVREVLHHDPDHKTARRLLGYIRSGDEWVTPFAAKMRRRNVWHEEFGWLPKTHVDQYERGQRYLNGRWISAAQEAEIRRDFKYAWEVRTEHYLVKTNHSLQRGVEVAKALEAYYENFFQLFAPFFNTPEQLEKLFSGGGSYHASRDDPYEVHYYRSRDEYNRRLIQKIPQIAITNGLYYTTDRTAYFFHDPDAASERTLYHEATHQLFYESSPKERPIAVEQNFWIVEGIACYMESFSREQGRLTVGDPRYIRFRAARHRYLVDEYYVPLARFARMGMQEFQSDPNLSKNYSQASGLAHFLMHYDDGRYRDPLIRHLAEIYHPNPQIARNPATLAELTSTEFAELDRQYGEYLKHLEDGLDRLQQQPAESTSTR